ncbi:MAG TPA: UDP-2,3-diacylglucosamine diphosphatase [Gemmatimonadaceae bacterium]
MLPSPTYVIGDIHLGAAPPEVERALLGFLRALRERRGDGTLLVNGDLFDFWFEWRTVIPRSGYRTLAALAELSESGMPVLFVAGNHDCWGGDALERGAGLRYHVGPWRGTLAGWRSLVEHGDGLRKQEDRRYRRLRSVLRHPLSARAFRLLHPDLASRVATGSSEASRTHRARDGGAGLRRVAHDALAADPSLELVIYGHSHVAALERAPSGGVYANAGSWLDAPTFLRLTPERVELRRWTGSAEGERLDAIDRGAEKALA